MIKSLSKTSKQNAFLKTILPRVEQAKEQIKNRYETP